MVPFAPLEDAEEPEPRHKMELYVSGGEVSAGRGGAAGAPPPLQGHLPAGHGSRLPAGVPPGEPPPRSTVPSGRAGGRAPRAGAEPGPAASSGARGRRHFLAAPAAGAKLWGGWEGADWGCVVPG